MIESCLDSEEKKKVSGEKREMLSIMSSITPASRLKKKKRRKKKGFKGRLQTER